jgi:hypothetical protein
MRLKGSVGLTLISICLLREECELYIIIASFSLVFMFSSTSLSTLMLFYDDGLAQAKMVIIMLFSSTYIIKLKYLYKKKIGG